MLKIAPFGQKNASCTAKIQIFGGVSSKIAHDKGRVARLVGDEALSMKDIINEVYLAAYSRPPAPEELEVSAEILFDAPGLTRKSAAEDIMWALINSAEFVFNH